MSEDLKKNLIRSRLNEPRKSQLKLYREIVYGGGSLIEFLYYELITSLLGPLPGGLGLFLRKKFYRRLFSSVGSGLIIGRNVVIRHPKKIILGDNVTIDDYCLLDGRGGGNQAGIELEDSVMINRNCMLLSKSGKLKIGRRSSIGSNSVMVSLAGIEIGEAVLTGGNCHVSAGLYAFDNVEKAVIDQEVYSNGPIEIRKHSYLGTGVTVLDGVCIGQGAVIGACSMVNKSIPDYCVAFGVPAKIRRLRTDGKEVILQNKY